MGVLGFDERPESPRTWQARGGCWFRWRRHGAAPGRGGRVHGVGQGASGAARPRARGAARTRCERRGVAVEDDTQLDGHDRWYVRDPFGNRLELIEEVASSMELPFQRLDPQARSCPRRSIPGDAGLDLRCAIDVVVAPGERAMVPTGVAVAIPDGHAGLVLPRSGLAVAAGPHARERARADRRRLPRRGDRRGGQPGPIDTRDDREAIASRSS